VRVTSFRSREVTCAGHVKSRVRARQLTESHSTKLKVTYAKRCADLNFREMDLVFSTRWNWFFDKTPPTLLHVLAPVSIRYLERRCHDVVPKYVLTTCQLSMFRTGTISFSTCQHPFFRTALPLVSRYVLTTCQLSMFRTGTIQHLSANRHDLAPVGIPLVKLPSSQNPRALSLTHNLKDLRGK